MGNRGILHDETRTVVRYHRHKHWIICKLSVGDRRRTLMTPGKYTELFFLDEATALAAGHRPCARCSQSRYLEFVYYWKLGNPSEDGPVDDVLHRDRFRPYRKNRRTRKRTYTAPIDNLPLGVFVMLDPDPSARPYLVHGEVMLPWSFAGYAAPVARPTGIDVTVLTPLCTVRTLAAGYRPMTYPERY
jgi:hypothetical protein